MNTLETLYFPDTKLISDRQFPLFLAFSLLHLLEPVENEQSSQKTSADTFMVAPYCQAHTPRPLGKDRDRFLYLLQDIRNRKDDYAAQLSQLTLASLAHGGRETGDRRSEIMSSIIKGTGLKPQEEKEQEQAEALWQARLTLAIAEILDQEEQDVAGALMVLEDHETELFSKLAGHDENGEEEEDLLTNLRRMKTKISSPSGPAMLKRLRAWMKLAESGPLPPSTFWTTTRQEIADMLFEYHEKEVGHYPETIFTLPLPLHIGPESDSSRLTLENFREQATSLREMLDETITKGGLDDGQESHGQKLEQGWKALLDKVYPETPYGRQVLSFYRFEKTISSTLGRKIPAQADSYILAVLPL